ncbi:hypothetical protein AAFF_G00440860 [Aldrovandia affinis]|uniref:Uncharacterized protein n=1 Tax=Aldrovandia affinis TaxID=143900 RepID=A0AAD7S7R5_9TELE|nr:hypothetical protein AAFF_G00440860 [Aldrovandia affinis]
MPLEAGEALNRRLQVASVLRLLSNKSSLCSPLSLEQSAGEPRAERPDWGDICAGACGATLPGTPPVLQPHYCPWVGAINQATAWWWGFILQHSGEDGVGSRTLDFASGPADGAERRDYPSVCESSMLWL